MKNKLCLPLFTLTIFISALLLFSIQPMFTKMVLPTLGGSPMVWNTAMVFFQAMLLLGYLYAHLLTTKVLEVKHQGIIHICMLLAVFFFLPISKAQIWDPSNSNIPPLWLLTLFTMSIGLPFFVISTTAPLMQKWFSYTDNKHAKDPYFLYAASNVGSILALLSYPFFLERILPLTEQGILWAIIYAILGCLVISCILFIYDKNPPILNGSKNKEIIDNKTKMWWILYAFIPSSLLLAVTSHISTDIASFPLLWVIPLALYLLTFVIAFAKNNIISHKFAVFIAPSAITLAAGILNLTIPNIGIEIFINLLIMFIVCLLFHSELVKKAPSTNHLTAFYLYMSVGGVLGGLFNSLVAPVIFNGIYEYYLIIFISALFTPIITKHKINKAFIIPAALIVLNSAIIIIVKNELSLSLSIIPVICVITMTSLVFIKKRVQFKFALIIALIMLFGITNSKNYKETMVRKRSFFNAYRIIADANSAALISGKTIHGAQLQKPEIMQTAPLSYYNKKGPVGDIFNVIDRKNNNNQNIAAIGLGTGNLSCYVKPNRIWTFYEIDSLTIKLANNTEYFHYLEKCSPNTTNIIIGDARLSLEKDMDDKYNAMFLDAFNSDAIPTHLLTKEALDMYFEKLLDDGIIAVHISNKYLNLAPVLAGYIDKSTNIYGMIKHHKADTIDNKKYMFFDSVWVVLSKNKDILYEIRNEGEWSNLADTPNKIYWDDNFSNIISILKK